MVHGRGGGVLSPWLFARYIRVLLEKVVTSGVGCNIDGLIVNVLAYADDIVHIVPSWHAMQRLLDIVAEHSLVIDMVINIHKTVCMVFMPKNHDRIIKLSFPVFCIGEESLNYVSSFKYLGHRIASNNVDNDDIQREIGNLFYRTNVLLRRFSRCSVAVKTVLFKSFCICMYDAALWTSYNIGVVNKLRSSYIKCIKIFFGYKRRDSVTGMLFRLGLPSFDTLLLNAAVSFNRQLLLCNNVIVRQLQLVNCKILYYILLLV